MNAEPQASFPWPERVHFGKRAFDVFIAGLALIFFAPLFALIAIAVRLTSPGPVLYRGRRIGLLGVAFDQLKFRTMTVQTEAASAFTSRDDVRVTPLGKLIRFVKLDELPQLINVLRGDMSIVGPRPEDATVVEEHYNREQLRVLTVRPGMTGLLQVRVYPDFTYDIPAGENPEQYYQTVVLPQRIEEDLEYVDRMSLCLDSTIVLQTAYCILFKTWFVLWQRARVRSSAAPLQPQEASHQ